MEERTWKKLEKMPGKREVAPRAEAIERLENYIAQHACKPGERLPGERELCERWGLSRTTIRFAIQRLTEEGKLCSRKGSGTYVAEMPMKRNLRDMKSTTEQIREAGCTPGSKVLRAEVVECNRYLSQRLQLPLGHKLFFLKRLRLADAVPSMLEMSYTDYERCPGIEKYSLDQISLYEVLKEYGVQMKEGNESIGITYATEEESEYLDVKEGAALFYLTSCSSDEEGSIFEFSKSVARPDRVHFINTLKRREVPAQEGSYGNQACRSRK